MREIVWGWPIVLYLWVAGIAGGAYLAAVTVNVLDGNRHLTLVRVATYLTIPLFVLGVLILTFDLGRPERVWHMFVSFRPTSPMWFGTYFLLIGSVVGAGLAVRELGRLIGIEPPWANKVEFWAIRLGWLFALIVVAYIGVVFAQADRRLLWSGTLLLPALFIASSLSTGIALLAVILRLTKVDEPQWVTRALHDADVLFIIIELGLLATFLAWLAASGGPVKSLLTGTLSIWFWVGLVLVGLLVPLLLELLVPAPHPSRWVVFVAPILVLAGGLVFRYVVVFGGQM